MSFVSALTRKAIADVTRRKGRTALVILGILIGVLGLTSVNLAGDEMGNAFAFRYDNRSWPDLAFYTQNQVVDASLLPGIQHIANIAQVRLRTVYDTRWHIFGGSGYVPLVLTGNPDNSSDALGTFQLTSGHLPGPGEVVMESSDNAIQTVALGNTITIDSPHGTITLRIVGLARTPGNAFQKQGALAYMRSDALQQLAKLSGPNDLLVKLHVVNSQTLQQAFMTIRQYLHNHGFQNFATDTQIIADPDQVVVSSVLNAIRVVSLIALLLTCFLLINTMGTLITEQIRTIGTMKALGGRRWKIMQSYLISVSMYAFVGTGLGTVLGIGGGALLAQNFATTVALNLGPLTVSPWVIAVSLTVGLILPLLTALIPLIRGTSITVRQAMTAYGVQYNGRRLPTAKRDLSWVSQTARLGLRGVFRKPGRAVLTLLALTLSSAAFLAVQITTASISASLNELAHTYSSDVSISVQPQPYQQLLNLLRKVPNVDRIERRLTQTVQVQDQKLDLVGLEPKTELYQRHLVAGRWLAENETTTLVLSDVAAESLGLHVGNELTFSTNQNQSQVNWRIVGIVHDLNKDLGSNTVGVAYTNIEGVNALDNAPPDETSNLMVRAKDHSPAEVDKLAKDLYSALTHGGSVPSITTLQQQIQQVQGPAQIVYAIFDLVAVIVALVGILGLFSTLSSSVLERRLEIGVLRSLGASGRRVAMVFLVEGVALAVLAWMIGTALGVPGAYGLVAMLSQQLAPLDFLFNPVLILATLLFILLIVALACIGPTLTASRLRIRELLSYE